MTRDYLVGELSMRLERLHHAARGTAARDDVASLRREVEARPVTGLATEMARALALGDRLCWESLSRGDSATFDRQATICADLRLFGACSRLIEDE